MPFFDLSWQPWCSGRVYPNAPAGWKIRSLTRPPPYFWLITAEGVPEPIEEFNGSHLLRPRFNALNRDPHVNWESKRFLNNAHYWELSWGKHFGYTPPLWAIRVSTRHQGFADDFATWGLPGQDSMSDWLSIDGTTPTFEHSDWEEHDWTQVEITIHVGTYERIPPNSCYGGPYEPPV